MLPLNCSFIVECLKILLNCFMNDFSNRWNYYLCLSWCIIRLKFFQLFLKNYFFFTNEFLSWFFLTMRPVKCFVDRCKSTRRSSCVERHFFPENPIWRNRWLRALKSDGVTPPKGAFVCGLHFKTEDFQESSRHLKSDAIPSENLWWKTPKRAPKKSQ